MKKIFFVLLSIIFILSCGNGKIEKKNIEVQENNEKVQLRYIFPDGLPALSILSLFSEKKQFDEKTYISAIPDLAFKAFEDQCTTANPRLPKVTELEELYKKSYYGK